MAVRFELAIELLKNLLPIIFEIYDIKALTAVTLTMQSSKLLMAKCQC